MNAVNRPEHYQFKRPATEIADITDEMNFNRGNVVKYVYRAGHKDPDKEIEDLEKAQNLLGREIMRCRKLYTSESQPK